MTRAKLFGALVICAAVAGALLLSSGSLTAQGNSGKVVVPTPYNPYPPGILPADIVPELERVRREVNGIFTQALAEWKALGPITFTGNPPTIQGNGYQANLVLGKLMNFDVNMSPFKNRACASCHMPYAGFSGPIPSVNLTMVAYPGSFAFRAGKRTAQRYTYSPKFPVLQFNAVQQLFYGGNFWDSRATGYLLQDPDAEQAQHPPVDTQEMQNPDTACIAFKLSQAQYRPLFEAIWGAGSLDIKFPPKTEEICATPGGAAIFGTDTTPIKLKTEDRLLANDVFNHWGQSISFYEDGPEVSPYTSKFDAYLAGNATLTQTEMDGYNLFRGQAGCNTCHLDGRGGTQPPGTGSGSNPSTTPTLIDTSAAADVAPLFTCFGSANLGLPLNPRNAFYYQTTPDFFGFTGNPLGFGYRDLGLGTFLRSGFGSAPNPNSAWIPLAPTVDGQMQVSTARNVAMVPPQCPTTEAPGPYFQKEFFHNGYIKSLKQLVHFYNTRDLYSQPVTSGHCPSGTVEKVNCWPVPEVPGAGFKSNPPSVFASSTIDMTVGNLGLTLQQEDQIVAFLQTLTDGFNPANPTVSNYPNINTYTGTCMTGGTAATQGNAFLILTPPLPPCASVVCGVPPVPNPPILSQ